MIWQMNWKLDNSMVRRRRFTSRRRRTFRRRRYTRRGRYPRGSVYRSRSMSNRTLTGLVKRLYKINEVKQVRSDYLFYFNPVNVLNALANTAVFPILFPAPLASGLSAQSDSTFEGNIWQPIALKIRLSMSMNGLVYDAGGLLNSFAGPYPYGGWLRVIVYQVKSGNAVEAAAGNPPNGVNFGPYHELAGSSQFDAAAYTIKTRILGNPASATDTQLLTNYFNEPTSPLRVGIRGLARILYDRRWSFSSHGRNSYAVRTQTRRPSTVKYVESPQTSDNEEIIIPIYPSNQIYIMFIATFDARVMTMLASTPPIRPVISCAANYELVYRDA